MEDTESVFPQEFRLPNGLAVIFEDHTRHYFGGYWHVRLLVRCKVPVVLSHFENQADAEDAKSLLGDQVEFARYLEKMAVPGDEKAAVMEGLVRRGVEHLLPFMGGDRFQGGFLRAELKKRKKPVPFRFLSFNPAGGGR